MEPFIEGLKRFIVSQEDFTTNSSHKPNAFYTIKSVAKIQIPCNLKARIKNGKLKNWLKEIEFLDIVFEGTFYKDSIRQNAAGKDDSKVPQMPPRTNQNRPVKPVTKLVPVSPRLVRLQERSDKSNLKPPQIVKVSIPISANSSEKHPLNLVTYQKVVPDASQSSHLAGSHVSSTSTVTQVMDQKPLPHTTTQVGLQGTSDTSPRKRKGTSQNQVPDTLKQLDLNPKLVLEKITPETLNSSGMKMNLRVFEEQQISADSDIYIDNAEQNFIPPDLKKEFIEQEHESWLPNKDLESSQNSTKKVDSQTGENSRFRRKKIKMADEYLSDGDFEDFSDVGVDENDSSDDSWHPEDPEDLPVVFQKNVLSKESQAIPEKAETQKPKIPSGSKKSRLRAKSPGTVAEAKVKRNGTSTIKILDTDNSKIVDGEVEKLKRKGRKSSAISSKTKPKCPSNRRHYKRRKPLEGEGHSDDPQKVRKRHVASYLTCKFCEEKFYRIRPFNIHVESHFNNEGNSLSVEQEPSTPVTSEIPTSTISEIPTSVTMEIPTSVTREIPTSVTMEMPTSVPKEIPTSVTREIPEVVSWERSLDNIVTNESLAETDEINMSTESVQDSTIEELTQILSVKDEMSEILLNAENDTQDHAVKGEMSETVINAENDTLDPAVNGEMSETVLNAENDTLDSAVKGEMSETVLNAENDTLDPAVKGEMSEIVLNAENDTLDPAVKGEMSEIVLNAENDTLDPAVNGEMKEGSEPVQRVDHSQMEKLVEDKSDSIINTDPNSNDGKLPSNHSDRHFKPRSNKNYDILTCEKCPGKYFKSIAGYNIHLQTCPSEETRQMFVCPICHKEFSSPNALLKHNKGMHPQNLLFSCNICNDDVKFRTKRSLMNHKKEMHLSDKLHVCHICGKSYNKKTKLKYHLQRHSDIKPFQCQGCEKSFPSEYFLGLHFKQVHVRQFIYQCELCGKSCKTPGALRVHQAVHSNVRNFVCHICNMAFKVQRSLQRHLRSHDAKPNSFKCDLCEKSFSSKVNLKRHNKTAHTDNKPFKCEFCDKAFKLNSLLAQHSRVHKLEKDFSCQFCGKTFSFNSSLHSHLKCHHQSEMSAIKATENDITCYICGKICISNYSLSVHLRTHTTP